MACLEFSSADDGPRRRDLDVSGLAMIMQDPYSKVGDLLGRILVVEDLTKDVIEIVGSSLKVNPQFFAAVLHASRADVTAIKPPPPAGVGTHECVHARYSRSFDFGQMASLERLRLDANVRRKVVVLKTATTSVGAIQGCISTLLRVKQGEMWFGEKDLVEF